MRWLLLFVLSISLLAGNPFMGISHEESTEPEGILVTRVVDGSPAEIAGLEDGDIILSIDDFPIHSRQELSKLLEKKSPGDLLELDVQRCSKKVKIPMILGNRDDYTGSLKQGGREFFPTKAEDIHPEWRVDSISTLIFETITKADMDTEYEKLAGAFKTETQLYHGHYTLDALLLPLLEPAATHASYKRISELIRYRNGSISEIAAGLSAVLDCGDSSRFDIRKPQTEVHLEKKNLEALLQQVRRANELIDRFFAPLSEEELNNIEDVAPFLLDIFSKTVLIQEDPDEELADRYYDMLASSKKLDFGILTDAGQQLAALWDVELLAALENLQPDDGQNAAKDILIDRMVRLGSRDSAGVQVNVMGRLIVTGREARTYSEEAAIWIDLGGDDTYFGFCGGTPYTIFDNYHHNFHQGRAGVHIDLGGNDRYIRNTTGSIGAGYTGCGILIDQDGNDTYSGNRLSMGSAYFGVGILLDSQGDDVYTGQEEVMGFGLFGAGMVWEGAGDDLYHAARYAQGVGVTKGMGLLVDRSGDDRYAALFKAPNGYGNEGSWEGWSQGVGMGFRSFSAGGIGILCDNTGNDSYEAGNFSQACGYFFGFGIFEDDSGDDTVIGNRYVQGAGAHQAVSHFIDWAGDDSYLGREAMNQGGAWDIQTSFFIDLSGNDSYQGSSYAQGGTAQTAFTFFLDADGEDTYQSGNISNGDGGGLTYHPDYDARNLTIAIDTGTDNDHYNNVNRKNNTFMKVDDDKKEETGDGIFLDR